MRSAIVILALLGAAPAAAGEQTPVPYPDGYRNWRHVKSMVIEQGHPLFESFGGFHHIYANAKALEGYRSGSFPDGSVLVFDLLEAVSSDNAITEGRRKVVGVMVRNRRLYAATGGWGFEGFKGDSRTERVVGANAKTACFDCHAAQSEADYVFSKLRP